MIFTLDDFDPRLTRAERRGYFTTPYDSRAAAGYVARLMLAEKLVFVFPQLWFNVPAILKGFFDRVLVPGVRNPSRVQVVDRHARITPGLPARPS